MPPEPTSSSPLASQPANRPRRLPRWLRPRWLRRLGSSLMIGGQAVSAIARGKISPNDLMEQLFEAGPGSILIVVITGLASGTVFDIQVAAELVNQGAGSTVGGILAIGLAREIAPILTATLITGKVATAYAAQLGTMKVTEQIDAITMLRTDPVEYLVLPRLIALSLMMPLLCLYSDIVGMIGGAVVGVGIAAHEGQLFAPLNQVLGVLTALGLITLCVSAFVMWRRRAPEGVLGAPPPIPRATPAVPGAARAASLVNSAFTHRRVARPRRGAAPCPTPPPRSSPSMPCISATATAHCCGTSPCACRAARWWP